VLPYSYNIVQFWDTRSEGWQYGSALHRLLPNASWQELLSGLVCKWLNCLTDSSRFLPSIMQNKNSVWPHLNCMDWSVLAFLNYTDGSVWSDLNCTDGSVWSDLNCMDGSIWSDLNCTDGSVWSDLNLEFCIQTQSAPTKFVQLEFSDIPCLLCN
jgi:hypothetical protein